MYHIITTESVERLFENMFYWINTKPGYVFLSIKFELCFSINKKLPSSELWYILKKNFKKKNKNTRHDRKKQEQDTSGGQKGEWR